MDLKEGKEKAKDYYSQEAKDYIKMYKGTDKKYPANLIRLKFVVERLKQNNAKTVLDVGCGTCGPMIKLLKEGFNVKGIDFSKEMVVEGKKELERAGFDPNLVSVGDLEDNLPDEKFDAMIALGVFPHIVDEKNALLNMAKGLEKNGLVLIEFRNDLFSAFTLNKYSIDFFLNRLIGINSLPSELSNEVIDFYAERFNVEKPSKAEGRISYSEVLAKFKNPLSIAEELFKPAGFSVKKKHFYHFHALPPAFEAKYPALFKELSLKMEHTLDWRGYFMASAFVVEAEKTINHKKKCLVEKND